MADIVFNVFKKGLMDGTFNLNAGGDTIKIRLLDDTDPTVESQGQDIAAFSGFTDVVAYVGSTDQTIITNATSQDDTNNLGQWDSTGASTPIDITWSALASDGVKKIAGGLIYKDTGTESTRIPMVYIDATDFLPAGNDVKITWALTGIVRLT